MNELIAAPGAPPALLNQLQAWARGAAGAYSPETERAWRQDSASFARHCASIEASSLPATPELVAGYVRAEVLAGRAHATIRRRVASIAKMHRAAQLPDPTKAEEVRDALKAAARTLGTTQRAAPALRLRDVDRIVDAVGADARRKRRKEPGLLLRERRDLAMLRVGYALLARANELASITVEAITWQDDGTALVQLLRRKTSTESKPCYLNREAAAALRAWIAAAGITTGHVFCALGKGGVPTGEPLSRCSISRSLKRRARTAGLGEEVSSHSLRRGMTQDLLVGGADIGSIAKAGGWKSPVMPLRYAEGVAANEGAVAQFFRKLGR